MVVFTSAPAFSTALVPASPPLGSGSTLTSAAPQTGHAVFFTTGQAPGSPFVWNVLAPLATKETCLKTKLALVKPFQAPPSQAHLGSSVPPPRYTCPGNDTLCPPLGVGHPQDRPGDFFTIPVLSTVGVYSRYSIHAYLPHLSLLPDLTDSFKYYSPLMKTKKHPLKEYCWLLRTGLAGHSSVQNY